MLSSALFWLDHYHVDGLRVDAVASMLYLDYSRKTGEWVPNIYGGNENLAAIYFLRRFNEEVYRNYPDVQTIAEESTAWPMVSRPTYARRPGLRLEMGHGLDARHAALSGPRSDPPPVPSQRAALPHDLRLLGELRAAAVARRSGAWQRLAPVAKMPGDDWQKFANLRLLFGYMFGQPGKKLLFMGGEWGQGREWDHDTSLDWHQLEHPLHAGVQKWVADLNRLYRTEPALHELDCKPQGFEWIDCNDSAASSISFLRKGAANSDPVLVLCNFTPIPRLEYQVGVPFGGFWGEMLNSDAAHYGGSGVGNLGGVEAAAVSCHGQPCSLTLALPPLGVVFLKGTTPPALPETPAPVVAEAPIKDAQNAEPPRPTALDP